MHLVGDVLEDRAVCGEIPCGAEVKLGNTTGRGAPIRTDRARRTDSDKSFWIVGI
jgi:hypothetical protein